MKEKYCSLCLAKIEAEDAPILTISGAGVARCLCDKCAEDIEAASTSREYADIAEALDRLSASISKNNIDDSVTLATMDDILKHAAARAALIKEGVYDFSKDEESEDEILEEIPEDMLESEEDKALDERDIERANKLDRVLNWVWAAVLAGTVGFLIWWFFLR